MNGLLERFAVGGQRGALVLARVVPAGLLDVEPSDVFKVLDGGEIPVAGAPPDLTRHVQLAHQGRRAARLYTFHVLRRTDLQRSCCSLGLRLRHFRFLYTCCKKRFQSRVNSGKESRKICKDVCESIFKSGFAQDNFLRNPIPSNSITSPFSSPYTLFLRDQ